MKYRKKPVVIEARQLSLTNAFDVSYWCGAKVKPASMSLNVGEIVISTLEGDMTAKPGDYIIKGVKGEFYPCRSDIFEATYDPVEDTPND